MKKALYLVAFLAGAAVGALASATYIKKNYDISEKPENSSDEFDYDSFKKDEPDEQEKLIQMTNNSILKSVKDPVEKEKAEKLLNRYFTKASVYGSDAEDTEDSHGPYRILEDAFGEFEDYSTVELTYYSDGVLADEYDEKIDNAEELLGKNFAALFGDRDEIFIRNDDLCSDYDIVKDTATYDEFDADRPHIHLEE